MTHLSSTSLIALATTLLTVFPPPAHAAAESPAPLKLDSIIGYCQAHRTVDYPWDKGFGDSLHRDIPLELSAIDANMWRCQDGQVLVCSDSADGDQCARKGIDRHPKIVAQVCKDQPELDVVPFYAGHPYRYDWRCRGGKPIVRAAYPLDRRGFFLKAWAPLIVRNGKVVSPKEAPAIIR